MSTPDVRTYDIILVAFSGGKDSVASLTEVLAKLPISEWHKVELWHHLVDGREGSTLMDWPVTSAYCQAVADHFGLEYYESWKEGGFEREMSRKEDPTAPFHFETPSGEIEITGGQGPENTRRKFPAVSADLTSRWCSSYLKIDVMASAIRNQDRFRGKRTLVITGERAEESLARSKYEEFEPHRADLRDGKRYQRHIDHWRPVLYWKEERVWSAMEVHNIVPHPCYYLGWSRCSCAGCIFGSADMFKTLRHINPHQFDNLADYEDKFDFTMKRKVSLVELVETGSLYEANDFDYWSQIATSHTYDRPIDFLPEERWELPKGAYGESSCGAP